MRLLRKSLALLLIFGLLADPAVCRSVAAPSAFPWCHSGHAFFTAQALQFPSWISQLPGRRASGHLAHRSVQWLRHRPADGGTQSTAFQGIGFFFFADSWRLLPGTGKSGTWGWLSTLTPFCALDIALVIATGILLAHFWKGFRHFASGLPKETQVWLQAVGQLSTPLAIYLAVHIIEQLKTTARHPSLTMSASILLLMDVFLGGLMFFYQRQGAITHFFRRLIKGILPITRLEHYRWNRWRRQGSPAFPKTLWPTPEHQNRMHFLGVGPVRNPEGIDPPPVHDWMNLLPKIEKIETHGEDESRIGSPLLSRRQVIYSESGKAVLGRSIQAIQDVDMFFKFPVKDGEWVIEWIDPTGHETFVTLAGTGLTFSLWNARIEENQRVRYLAARLATDYLSETPVAGSVEVLPQGRQEVGTPDLNLSAESKAVPGIDPEAFRQLRVMLRHLSPELREPVRLELLRRHPTIPEKVLRFLPQEDASVLVQSYLNDLKRDRRFNMATQHLYDRLSDYSRRDREKLLAAVRNIFKERNMLADVGVVAQYEPTSRMSPYVEPKRAVVLEIESRLPLFLEYYGIIPPSGETQTALLESLATSLRSARLGEIRQDVERASADTVPHSGIRRFLYLIRHREERIAVVKLKILEWIAQDERSGHLSKERADRLRDILLAPGLQVADLLDVFGVHILLESLSLLSWAVGLSALLHGTSPGGVAGLMLFNPVRPVITGLFIRRTSIKLKPLFAILAILPGFGMLVSPGWLAVAKKELGTYLIGHIFRQQKQFFFIIAVIAGLAAAALIWPTSAGTLVHFLQSLFTAHGSTPRHGVVDSAFAAPFFMTFFARFRKTTQSSRPATFENEQEREIHAIGTQLLAGRSQPQGPALQRRRLMRWGMRFPPIGFVLRKSIVHIQWTRVLLGGLILGTLAFSPLSAIAIFSGAAAFEGSVRFMAPQFIAGEDVPSALPTLQRLVDQDTGYNIDLVGEGVTSPEDPDHNTERIIQALEDLAAHQYPKLQEPGRPPIQLSLKLTTLVSTLDDAHRPELEKRLRRILDVASRESVNARIWIDAEEYAYRDVTLQVYRDMMEGPLADKSWHLGVVLQAYLKDSEWVANDLVRLSEERAARNQGPVCVRLVKGAYWDYEVKRAANGRIPVWHNDDLSLPPEERVRISKAQTDAAYERITTLFMSHHEHMRLAIASHDVRSLAHALVEARRWNVPRDHLEFQMLYGMEVYRAAVAQQGYPTSLYVPVGPLTHGLGYLVRRLDENTSQQSMLAASLEVNTDNAEDVDKLLASPHLIAALGQTERRYRIDHPEDLQAVGLIKPLIATLASFLRSGVWPRYLSGICATANPRHEAKTVGYFASGADISTILQATDATTIHLYDRSAYEPKGEPRFSSLTTENLELYSAAKQKTMPSFEEHYTNLLGGWTIPLAEDQFLKPYLFLELFASGVNDITEEFLDHEHKTVRLTFSWAGKNQRARSRTVIVHSQVDLTQPVKDVPEMDIAVEKANTISDPKISWAAQRRRLLRQKLRAGGLVIQSTFSAGLDSRFTRLELHPDVRELQTSGTTTPGSKYKTLLVWGYKPVEIWRQRHFLHEFLVSFIEMITNSLRLRMPELRNLRRSTITSA